MDTLNIKSEKFPLKMSKVNSAASSIGSLPLTMSRKPSKQLKYTSRG